MIADPWFYALAVPAMIIAGISKGGFGGGVVVLAVSLMSLTVPPQRAAAVMLPIPMAMDLLALWSTATPSTAAIRGFCCRRR
ncbi:MAG: hypothetical protein IH994_09810 [Proteobacteria bacterium]|nr:hypothetical protein [Pseudomonadota bacterium]